jgi:DNA-binding transcriptional ArsR family regulator
MTTASSHGEDQVRAASLTALSAWARTRDQLPTDRVELLALAWHTGNRNIQELARRANVSRDTVYADLRTAGIEPADRAAAVTTPRYEPLRANTVAQIADLAAARFGPAMLADDPAPLTKAAWTLGIALKRISDLLGDLAAPDRLTALDDLASRGEHLAALAHRIMAAEIPVEQLVRHTHEAAITSLELSSPAIGAATVTLQLPNWDTLTLDIEPRKDQPVLLRSDSPHVTGQLDAAAHLAITAALATIAEAVAPALADEVMAYDD